MLIGKVINHQKRNYIKKKKEGFITDHIIPYSISLNDSNNNLQFLTQIEHKEKTTIDLKIMKLFIKKGWIEKITNYSHELIKPMTFLTREYKKEFKNLQDIQDLQVT